VIVKRLVKSTGGDIKQEGPQFGSGNIPQEQKIQLTTQTIGWGDFRESEERSVMTKTR